MFEPTSGVPVHRRGTEDAEKARRTDDLDRINRIETAPVLPLACCFPVNPVNPVKGLFAPLRLGGELFSPSMTQRKHEGQMI
jgi:hypothetical protein